MREKCVFSPHTKGLGMKQIQEIFNAHVAVAMAGVLSVAGIATADAEEPIALTASEEIVASVTDVRLRLLLGEVLGRNPRLARMAAESAAVEQRSPQPDPAERVVATEPGEPVERLARERIGAAPFGLLAGQLGGFDRETHPAHGPQRHCGPAASPARARPG